MTDTEKPLRFTIGVSRKINIGNYENESIMIEKQFLQDELTIQDAYSEVKCELDSIVESRKKVLAYQYGKMD